MLSCTKTGDEQVVPQKNLKNISFGSIRESSLRYKFSITKTVILALTQISTFRTYNYIVHRRKLFQVLKQVTDIRLLYFSCDILSFQVSERVNLRKEITATTRAVWRVKRTIGVIHEAVEHLDLPHVDFMSFRVEQLSE